MKYVIKKSDAVTTQEDGNSRFYEYQFPFQNASLGVSEMNGRYPESGYDIDEKVEQSWYIESGKLVVWIDGAEHVAEQGDMVYIPAGQKYWIQGESCRLIVCSSPPWTQEQHKHIT